LKSYWDGEEKIWILDPHGENTGWKKSFTATAEKSLTATFVEDDKTTSFAGTTLMAVYPANPAGNSYWKGGDSPVEGMWLTNEQTAVAGSYDPSAHIAIAKTTASSNVLKFKNVSSLLKFQLAENMTGEVKFFSYKPESGDAPKIAGNFSVKYNDVAPVVTPESGENKVTFDAVSLKGEFVKDTDYLMAILPANLAYGFGVQINGYTVKELTGASLKDEKFASLLDRKSGKILDLQKLALTFGVCGTHNDWADTPMTHDEKTGLYVAQGVKFAGETNQFMIRAGGLRTSSVGTGGKILVNAENQGYMGGENSTIAAGTYDIWFNADKKIIYAMTPGKTPADVSGWAIWAETGEEWEQIEMLKTEVSNLFVTKGVKLEAYKSFIVKSSANWDTKYGRGSVNYIKANKWFTSVKGGADITVEAAGTYDIYFDSGTKNVYLMTAGTAYNVATKQTQNGVAPKVTIYLVPGMWETGGARYQAWIWGAGDQWVTFTKVSNNLYSTQVPEGTTGMKVLRKGPDHQNNAWQSWDDTGDLELDGHNCITITGWKNSFTLSTK
jgi:hypothetical protein